MLILISTRSIRFLAPSIRATATAGSSDTSRRCLGCGAVCSDSGVMEIVTAARIAALAGRGAAPG